MPPFAHLHVHSEYSLLDAMASVDALCARAAELDQPALALTDHGVMTGAVNLVKASARHGIKPIIGCEVYFVDDRRDRSGDHREHHHLTLLASTPAGYRNLARVSSAGFLEGYHRGTPTVDLEVLAAHADGVLALTGCLHSRLCQRLVQARDSEARAHADDLLQAFGADNVYFEVQRSGLAAQERANAGVMKIAREVGRPLVATEDIHYLRREDHDHHAGLLCVQTKSTLAEPELAFETDEFFLKSSDEMAAAFADLPEAIATTIEIADRCDARLELGQHLLPAYPTPDGSSPHDHLRDQAEQGLRERYGDPPPADAAHRLDAELAVIHSGGYDSYFLIVGDLTQFAQQNGIGVGPGRGAAAASIVNYCLGITDVDPLVHQLLFERFLNPERLSMPDIDIDFSARGREQVINYVRDKYGPASVAQIVTFGRMFPRAAIRNAARVLGHNYATGDRLAKLIPDPVMGRPPMFADCLKPNEALRRACDEDPAVRPIIDLARGFDGIVRNSSIHAASVVIADRPLTDIVPLQLARAGTDECGEQTYRVVTQYSMRPVEELGLLKLDFLGLRTLDLVDDTLDRVEDATGRRPDVAGLPVDDARTYELFSAGDTWDVFQFGSPTMREALAEVHPAHFDDLMALIALNRPGARDKIPGYARGKHEPDSIRVPDEALRSVLEPTNGVLLYQEQAMRIAMDVAGFSAAKADDLRKQAGKKQLAALRVLKPEFVAGCVERGLTERRGQRIWETVMLSSDWTFHRAHAACYALIAYRAAWLKAHHRENYVAAFERQRAG